MSLFNNSSLFSEPKPQKNNNLFRNNNSLFGNDKGETNNCENQNDTVLIHNNSNNLFTDGSRGVGVLFNSQINTNTNNKFSFKCSNNNSLFCNNNSNNMFGKNKDSNTSQILECSLNVGFIGRDVVEKNRISVK